MMRSREIKEETGPFYCMFQRFFFVNIIHTYLPASLVRHWVRHNYQRSQMWGPLLENFPDLAALGRLMYGNAARIIFNESGYGRSEVLSSVGCRQGCSWGSFLYCLTIPY